MCPDLPEVLPPSSPGLVRVWGWDVPLKKFKFARVIGVGGLFVLAGWLLQNFLQLRGVVNLFLSRIDLFFLALSLFIVGWVLTIGAHRKRRWRILVFMVLLVFALGIDWLTPKPGSSAVQAVETSLPYPTCPYPMCSPLSVQFPAGVTIAHTPAAMLMALSRDLEDVQKGGLLSRGGRLAFLSQGAFDFAYDQPTRTQRDWRVGEPLAFNVPFGNKGPNAVDVIYGLGRTYLEPDFEPATEKKLIADFKNEIGRVESNRAGVGEPTTMEAGDRKFMSAYALDGKQVHIITQQDLDDLRGLGSHTRLAFVLAIIRYNDNGIAHHLRRCAWIHTPATVSNTWQLCAGFNHSD